MEEKYIYNTLHNSLDSKYFKRILKGKMRYTFAQFKKEYPDDKACLKAVLENRYGDTCPRCGVVGVRFHPITGRQGFVCSECDKHIYPLADTIFRKSSTSLWNWFYAIYLFSVSKNGVSAKELERHLGVTYKTAWRMAKQIRLLMEQEKAALEGEVEIDETVMGGRHEKKYGYEKKQIIFGAIERDGMAKAKHVKSAGRRVLVPEIQSSIAVGSKVFSDEYRLYRHNLPKLGYEHAYVKHSSKVYVKGIAHTNTIEGFWGQLKRSIGGTYHCVSPKYLQSYINEFTFRYNYRAVAICPVLLELAGKPVSRVS